MTAFPKLLRSRLLEESHVRYAKSGLDAHASELEAEIENRKSSQTSVDFLLAVAKRPRPSTQQLTSLEKELKSVNRAREVLDEMAKSLASELEVLAHEYVCETDETYVRGLSAFENTEEWTQAVQRFSDKVKAFLATLGETRNMVSANYDRIGQRISSAASEAITRASQAGTELEQEIALINRAVDAHSALLADTPAANTTLERVPDVSFAEWTRRLRNLNIADMQSEFGRMIVYCEELVRTGLPGLATAITAAKAESNAHSHKYIVAYCDTLRQFSDTHWFKHTESELYLAALEQRFGKRIDGGAGETAELTGSSSDTVPAS